MENNVTWSVTKYILVVFVLKITFIATLKYHSLPKGYHLDVVGWPSIPHDPESDAGGSLSSW
jgi:hypothetical protein